MSFDHWLSEEYDVQFSATKELEMVVDTYGFVKRMFAISTAALEYLGFAPEEKDEALQLLLNMALDGEKMSLENLETFLESETDPVMLNLKREQYFPAMQFHLNIVNDEGEDVQGTAMVVVNERRDGAANWYRFIALVRQEETEPFQLERTHM